MYTNRISLQLAMAKMESRESRSRSSLTDSVDDDGSCNGFAQINGGPRDYKKLAEENARLRAILSKLSLEQFGMDVKSLMETKIKEEPEETNASLVNGDESRPPPPPPSRGEDIFSHAGRGRGRGFESRPQTYIDGAVIRPKPLRLPNLIEEKTITTIKEERGGNQATTPSEIEDHNNNNNLTSTLKGTESGVDNFQDVKGQDDISHELTKPICSSLLPKRHGLSNSSLLCRNFDLMDFLGKFPHGGKSYYIKAEAVMTIQNLHSPIGITVLPKTKNIVVGLTKSNKVHMYGPSGQLLKSIQPGRAFFRPSDMVSLPDGKFAIRDHHGIQLFSGDGQFIRSLGQPWLGLVFGLTTDGRGNLITINTNSASGRGNPANPTAPGEYDVLILNIETNKIERRIELVDIIRDKVKSKCRFLHCDGKRLFIVDLGLNCVYVMSLGKSLVRTFGAGGKGPGQFIDPAGLVSDSAGNIIIADAGNHRIQVFDRARNYVCLVHVSGLKRPSGIFMDPEENALFVLNLKANNMVKYVLKN